MKHLVLGSYSTKKQIRVGTGSTRQDREQTIIWLAAQLPTADICIQPLNPANIPTGFVSTISGSEFFQTYFPEADCYDQYIRPGVKKLSEWLEGIGTPMPTDKPDKETGLFLRSFLAILHGECDSSIQEGDPDKLRMLAQQAAEMHFLENFRVGIAFAAVRQRKERNYPLAIDFCTRALAVREDDHLLFNTARTYYEMKNIELAKECLLKALELNPELAIAQQFLKFIDTQQ